MTDGEGNKPAISLLEQQEQKRRPAVPTQTPAPYVQPYRPQPPAASPSPGHAGAPGEAALRANISSTSTNLGKPLNHAFSGSTNGGGHLAAGAFPPASHPTAGSAQIDVGPPGALPPVNVPHLLAYTQQQLMQLQHVQALLLQHIQSLQHMQPTVGSGGGAPPPSRTATAPGLQAHRTELVAAAAAPLAGAMAGLAAASGAAGDAAPPLSQQSTSLSPSEHQHPPGRQPSAGPASPFTTQGGPLAAVPDPSGPSGLGPQRPSRSGSSMSQGMSPPVANVAALLGPPSGLPSPGWPPPRPSAGGHAEPAFSSASSLTQGPSAQQRRLYPHSQQQQQPPPSLPRQTSAGLQPKPQPSLPQQPSTGPQPKPPTSLPRPAQPQPKQPAVPSPSLRAPSGLASLTHSAGSGSAPTASGAAGSAPPSLRAPSELASLAHSAGSGSAPIATAGSGSAPTATAGSGSAPTASGAAGSAPTATAGFRSVPTASGPAGISAGDSLASGSAADAEAGVAFGAADTVTVETVLQPGTTLVAGPEAAPGLEPTRAGTLGLVAPFPQQQTGGGVGTAAATTTATTVGTAANAATPLLPATAAEISGAGVGAAVARSGSLRELVPGAGPAQAVSGGGSAGLAAIGAGVDVTGQPSSQPLTAGPGQPPPPPEPNHGNSAFAVPAAVPAATTAAGATQLPVQVPPLPAPAALPAADGYPPLAVVSLGYPPELGGYPLLPPQLPPAQPLDLSTAMGGATAALTGQAPLVPGLAQVLQSLPTAQTTLPFPTSQPAMRSDGLMYPPGGMGVPGYGLTFQDPSAAAAMAPAPEAMPGADLPSPAAAGPPEPKPEPVGPGSLELESQLNENRKNLLVFPEDDDEDGDDDEDVLSRPPWYKKTGVLWFLGSTLVAMVLTVIGVLLHEKVIGKAASDTEVFRWLYFVAGFVPIYWFVYFTVSRVFWIIEWMHFRENLTYLQNIKENTATLIAMLLMLIWFQACFRWMWCEAVHHRCNSSSYKKAVNATWKAVLCTMLFCLANVLKAVLAKFSSMHFYRTAHFKKLKDSLEKEYYLQILSVPRSRLLAQLQPNDPRFREEAVKGVPLRTMIGRPSMLVAAASATLRRISRNPAATHGAAAASSAKTLQRTSGGGGGSGGLNDGGSAPPDAGDSHAHAHSQGQGFNVAAVTGALNAATSGCFGPAAITAGKVTNQGLSSGGLREEPSDASPRERGEGCACFGSWAGFWRCGAASDDGGRGSEGQLSAGGGDTATTGSGADGRADSGRSRPEGEDSRAPWGADRGDRRQGEASPQATPPLGGDGAAGGGPHLTANGASLPSGDVTVVVMEATSPRRWAVGQQPQPPPPPPPAPPPPPPPPPSTSAVSSSTRGGALGIVSAEPFLAQSSAFSGAHAGLISGTDAAAAAAAVAAVAAGGGGGASARLVPPQASGASPSMAAPGAGAAAGGSAGGLLPHNMVQLLSRAFGYVTGSPGRESRPPSQQQQQQQQQQQPPQEPVQADSSPKQRHVRIATVEGSNKGQLDRRKSSKSFPQRLKSMMNELPGGLAPQLQRRLAELGAEAINAVPLEIKRKKGVHLMTEADLEKVRDAIVIKTYTALIRKHSGMSEEEELRELRTVKRFAKALYFNLRGPDPIKTYVTVDDFKLFFGDDEDMAKKAFEVFDVDKDGKLTRQEVRDRVISIYAERRNMARSLRDTDSIVQSLELSLGIAIHFLFGAIYLTIWGVPLLEGFSAFSATVLALTFIFGNAAKNAFESVLFLFFEHPYDVGDMIYFNGDSMRVKRISLMYTDFVKWTNEEIYIPNTKVMSMEVTNWTRTKTKFELHKILVDVGVAWDVKEDIANAIVAHCNANPNDFTGTPRVTFREVVDPLKVYLGIGFTYNFPPDDFDKLVPARDKVMYVVQSKLAEHKLRFSRHEINEIEASQEIRMALQMRQLKSLENAGRSLLDDLGAQLQPTPGTVPLAPPGAGDAGGAPVDADVTAAAAPADSASLFASGQYLQPPQQQQQEAVAGRVLSGTSGGLGGSSSALPALGAEGLQQRAAAVAAAAAAGTQSTSPAPAPGVGRVGVESGQRVEHGGAPAGLLAATEADKRKKD